MPEKGGIYIFYTSFFIYILSIIFYTSLFLIWLCFWFLIPKFSWFFYSLHFLYLICSIPPFSEKIFSPSFSIRPFSKKILSIIFYTSLFLMFYSLRSLSLLFSKEYSLDHFFTSFLQKKYSLHHFLCLHILDFFFSRSIENDGENIFSEKKRDRKWWREYFFRKKRDRKWWREYFFRKKEG